jgi:hypothetical protein
LEAAAAVEISVESWEEEEGAIPPDHLPQTSVKRQVFNLMVLLYASRSRR